ncbi:MAG: SDR family NAD(P)-dependent oxidoreductase, partial [SAR324 cluster bacterium]|nr:SDR family NAD(P)-dependent oxidoreductase [SAR324 cluster bacterium]
MKKAVILGVGPEGGLGAQLALRFAREGMHVLAASRTPSALEKLVSKIRESGGEATAVPTDATNEEQVVSLFENTGADLEIAVYNAGNNHPGRIVEMDTEYFENSWRVCCLGGFLFGR